ncbi:CotA family spore coat protein [Pseudoflavonifractor sp. An85]|uniref:CotA family spore coat protein n=1 Tax=Pseudoflavonifractor sp. An85 TaxID=1965661 RepID=UPI000B377A39|nr:CotA family spore coat protein [Pseudoflavonifractor sp. An85]OUN22658.1 hypothetical protein B5G37_09625 [Pseudoflavonifractor sp. An85]
MNQTTWNPQSWGSLTAEEFAAQQCSGTATSSTQTGCGCHKPCTCNPCANPCPTPCQPTQMICCCQPVAAPCPPVVDVEEGCCCKQSFRAALQLLCNSQLATLLDFNQAAFVTDTYVAGATINTTPAGTTPADNLNTMSGSFRRFSPCNCDLLEISALVNTPPETSTGVTATQVPLCQLTAVALQTATAPASGDITSDQATANNFQTIQKILSQCLNPCTNPCSTPCGACACSCACSDDECCCAAGLLSTLSQSNLSRKVTIVAGPLVLQGVTLLGTVGNVLVLANSTNNRIYFVCVNQIQFLG